MLCSCCPSCLSRDQPLPHAWTTPGNSARPPAELRLLGWDGGLGKGGDACRETNSPAFLNAVLTTSSWQGQDPGSPLSYSANTVPTVPPLPHQALPGFQSQSTSLGQMGGATHALAPGRLPSPEPPPPCLKSAQGPGTLVSVGLFCAAESASTSRTSGQGNLWPRDDGKDGLLVFVQRGWRKSLLRLVFGSPKGLLPLFCSFPPFPPLLGS